MAKLDENVRIVMLKGEKGEAGNPTDEQVQSSVAQYIQEHPDVTVDVEVMQQQVDEWLKTHAIPIEDGSITDIKLADDGIKKTVGEHTQLIENMPTVTQQAISTAIDNITNVEEIVLGTTWTEQNTQTVTVSGLSPQMNPIFYPKLEGTNEEKQAVKEEWNKIIDIDVDTNVLTFYCSEPTTQEITVCKKGV